MGTGHRSPGSGGQRLSSAERKPPLDERSDAHLLVREAANEIAEEYHEDAPEGETDPDGEAIQTILRGWGTPLREGAVGGPPSRERGGGSSDAESGSSGAESGGSGARGGGAASAVGSVGGAASSTTEAAAGDSGSAVWAVGAVAVAEREESTILDEQISDLFGLGESRLDALHEAGYRTPADVLQASTEELMQVDSIGEAVAERVRETVIEEYDRPEAGIDYGLGLGEGTTPEDLPEWGQQFVDDVDDDVGDAIGDTNFEIMTHQGPDGSRLWLDSTDLETIEDDERANGIEYVETLYQSSAAKMAAHARDDDTAQRIFENVAEGISRTAQSENELPRHGQTEEGSRLQIPDNAVELDLMHELGHATTYSHGYDIHERGRESLNEYRDRISDANADPYVYVDPENPDYLLSQDHGEEIEGVSEEFETLIDRTNEAFQRIHRAHERGEDPQQYVAGINYSGLSATEFFGVFHSYMQANRWTVDEHPRQTIENFELDLELTLFYQPEVAKSYAEVFDPGNIATGIIKDFRDDPSIETPYDEYQFPDERE